MANDHAQYLAEYYLAKHISEKQQQERRYSEGIDTTWRPKKQYLNYGECTVCLEEICSALDSKDISHQPKRTRVACSPCGHYFHFGCIELVQDRYEKTRARLASAGSNKLATYKCKCPNCNSELVSRIKPMTIGVKVAEPIPVIPLSSTSSHHGAHAAVSEKSTGKSTGLNPLGWSNKQKLKTSLALRSSSSSTEHDAQVDPSHSTGGLKGISCGSTPIWKKLTGGGRRAAPSVSGMRI